MKHPIDPLVVEAFTTAVKTTFEQLTNTTFEALEGPNAVDSSADHYSAYLELQRTKPGVLAIAMPPSLLVTLAGRYVPASVEVTTDMQEDALREWLNVIAGQAKTLLKGTQYHYLLSLPQSGQYLFSKVAEEPVISIRFEASEGALVLRVMLPACA